MLKLRSVSVIRSRFSGRGSVRQIESPNDSKGAIAVRCRLLILLFCGIVSSVVGCTDSASVPARFEARATPEPQEPAEPVREEPTAIPVANLPETAAPLEAKEPRFVLPQDVLEREPLSKFFVAGAPLGEETQADLKQDVDELWKLWSRDGEAALAEYGGRVVRLEGIVKSTARRESGIDTLGVSQDRESFREVVCFMAERGPWRRATPGQDVIVIGRLLKTASGPMLSDVVIVDVEGSPTRSIEAALLTDRAIETEFIDRYEFKPLIVRGTVVERRMLEDDETIGDRRTVALTLKGDGGETVDCHISGGHLADAMRISRGTSVRLLGTFGFDADGFPLLTDCVLMDEVPE